MITKGGKKYLIKTQDKVKNKMSQDYNFADPKWESYEFGPWTIPKKRVTVPDFALEDEPETQTEPSSSIQINNNDEKCDCGKSKHTVEIREAIIFYQMLFNSATAQNSNLSTKIKLLNFASQSIMDTSWFL